MPYLRLTLGFAIYVVAIVLAAPALLLIHVSELLGDVAEDIMGDS